MVYDYLITTILVAVSLGIVVFSFALKKVNYYIFVLLLFMTLANTGYLASALSGDISEAILANKICYLGGCFTPTINLCFICALCNYRVTPWQRAGMYTYSAFVYLMVLMIGYNDFYYAETSLESYGAGAYLRTGSCFLSDPVIRFYGDSGAAICDHMTSSISLLSARSSAGI